MTLKLCLKPGETLHLGTSTVTVVSHQTTTLLIDGDIAVLRGGMVDAPADSAHCLLRLCWLVQQIYLSGEPQSLFANYFETALILVRDHPELASEVVKATALLTDNRVYLAFRHLTELRKRFAPDCAASELH